MGIEYVNDIYCYLRHLETVQCIEAEYLAGQTEILPKMRAVLIDWLVGVQLQFHLLQETLYTTVAIIDRFLQVEVGAVSRNKLQLVGVAAMLVAAKYEEIYAPEVKDFVYITDRAYTEKDILRMEIRILATLKFDLGRPLPLHFLRRASKAGGVEAATHTLAKYIVELSLGVYNLCDLPPSRSKQHCFELFCSGNEVIKACKTDSEGEVVEGKHTVYRMSASTEEEKDDWIKCIHALFQAKYKPQPVL